MITTATPSIVPPSESLLVGTAAAAAAAAEESLPFALDVSNIPVRTREHQQAEKIVSPTASTRTGTSTSTRMFTGSQDRGEQEKEEQEEEKMVHAEVWTDYAMYTDYYAVVLDKKDEVTATAAATAGNTTTVTIPSNSLPRTNVRQDDMVLASLLSGNIRGEPQLQHCNANEDDPRMTTTSATTLNNSTSTSVLQQCQYAAQQAQLASTYLAAAASSAAAAMDGTQNVSLAVQSLYSSSNHYKAPAAAAIISTLGSNRNTTNINSGYTGIAATSLALLSKYHWKRAEAIRLATSHQHSSRNHENPAPPSSSHPKKTSSQHSPFHINNTRPPSATVTRIRDALHANPPEEDISASVFFGNTPSGNTNPTTNVTLDSTSTKTGEATSTTSNISSSTTTISSSQNPVDDMLQLEKELHTMNMALSMHASVAHLQAVAAATATSTPHKSYTTNPNTNTNLLLSQLRNAAVSGTASTSYNNTNLLDSSCWWGQSSFLHPRSDMASSISSWATTTSTLCNNPISTTTTTKPIHPRLISTSPAAGNTTNNSSGSDSLVHHTCQLDTDNTNATQEMDSSNSYSNNNAKQVLRLLDALKVLSDENASLLEQVEEAKRARLEAKAAKEEMKRFQLEYQKRFHTLKLALDKLHQQQQQQQQQHQQQQLQITDDKANFILSSEILSSKAKDNTALNQTRQQVQSLQLQLQKLQQESKKKDATLKKYENFYKEVKARSAQRAAQRSASISSASSSDVVK